MCLSVPSGYNLLTLSLIGLVCYLVIGGVRRLYFSPISNFPGPKLAALTFWYEFYYDVVLGGRYLFRIRNLHKKYGPIVRINPYELHINDPDFYDTLYASYASGQKREKWAWYGKQFNVDGAAFATVDHDHHKLRRGVMNRYFSTASVRRLQPLLSERVQQLVKTITTSSGLVLLDMVLAAFINDMAVQYIFGQSDHRIEESEHDHSFYHTQIAGGKMGNFLKHFPWTNIAIQIEKIRSEPSETFEAREYPTVFHEVLHSSLDDSEKTTKRLMDEGIIILGNHSGELRNATPNIASVEGAAEVPLANLEKLPYLTAVIQEALRLSYGVVGRLARIAPENAMHFTDAGTGKTWNIPPGTPVSMTSVLVHHDESIFPDSNAFEPERWLENPRLTKYQLAFSKGSRQCLGMNLAYAEIYLALSTLFLLFGSGGKDGVRFDSDQWIMQLWDTDITDVELQCDAFVPLPRKDSKGVRIMISK